MHMMNSLTAPSQYSACQYPKLWVYLSVAFSLTIVVVSLWLIWFYWLEKMRVSTAKLLHALANTGVEHSLPVEENETPEHSENLNSQMNRDIERGEHVPMDSLGGR